MNNLREAIRSFVLEKCLPGENPSNLHDDFALRRNGVVDSLALLKLVDVVEQTAGISIAPHEVNEENFESVSSILAFVEKKQGGQAR
jgi:acyl carrier protein